MPVQYIFLFILIGALGIGLVVLGLMGLHQRRRRGLMARAAHEMGMKFSAGDPFDLTRRYSAFVLSSAGHSQRAENVLYGRYEGWYLRIFDYHLECGHGPRRLTRRYSVIVADTDLIIPSALMWHSDDAEHAPLAARRPVGRVRQWLVISGAWFAPALAEAFADFADQPVGLQTNYGSVMLCSAARFKPAELPAKMNSAVAGLSALRAEGGAL
ncbi:MAG: hypothetical protein AMJ81_01145 [Phycisphaerae bacterium SM23_33]|nr:MAG: hypothetical protein AMJ81_01145 [Phycisphaerae bacterium SM23_33]